MKDETIADAIYVSRPIPLDAGPDRHALVLRALRMLAADQAELDQRIAEMVRAALDLGFDYTHVGRELGVSRMQLDALLVGRGGPAGAERWVGRGTTP